MHSAQSFMVAGLGPESTSATRPPSLAPSVSQPGALRATTAGRARRSVPGGRDWHDHTAPTMQVTLSMKLAGAACGSALRYPVPPRTSTSCPPREARRNTPHRTSHGHGCWARPRP